MLKVEDIPEDEESDIGGDDISEPDEDSLAGQMALMKGGKVRPSAVHGEQAEGEEEEDGSEYESSSDEDGPRKGRAINEDSDSDDD